MIKDKKLLFLDIEWSPALAYVWRMWDENISPDQLIHEGGMLCFCYKFSDEKEYHFLSEWEHGREGMAKEALRVLTEADAIITYNGDKYDIPKLRGEIVLAGLTPPPTVTSIDLLKVVKKFGFVMNRLAYIGPLLAGASKEKNGGFTLWKEVLEGKVTAQRKMEKYNVQDVKLLVKLYDRVRPFISNHPHLGSTKQECGACGSNSTQSRGYRRTKYFKIQRIQCNDCGAWSDGTRSKVE